MINTDIANLIYKVSEADEHCSKDIIIEAIYPISSKEPGVRITMRNRIDQSTYSNLTIKNAELLKNKLAQLISNIKIYEGNLGK